MAGPMTEEQNHFLAKCETQFSGRYSEADREFIKVKNEGISKPPVVKPWKGQGEAGAHGSQEGTERDLKLKHGGKMNSADESNITFWFLDLQSKSWLQKSTVVNKHTSVRELKSVLWFRMGEDIADSSWVYNGMILGYKDTLKDCGLEDSIVLVRPLLEVDKNDDVAELEKAKIILHQKERLSNDGFNTSYLVDRAQNWMHRAPEKKKICQIHREKLNKDLPKLLSEIGRVSGTEGLLLNEWIRMIIKNLKLEKDKHAGAVLSKLYRKFLIEGGLEVIFQVKIYDILALYSKELQGKSISPTCGGIFFSVFSNPRFCFCVGPTRSGMSSLPTFDINIVSPSLTVADLINAYKDQLKTETGFMDCELHGMEDILMYDSLVCLPRALAIEIVDVARFERFYFSFSEDVYVINGIQTNSGLLSDDQENMNNEKKTIKVAAKEEGASPDNRDVNELLKFIEGDQTSRKIKKKQKKKKNIQSRAINEMKEELNLNERLSTEIPESLDQIEEEEILRQINKVENNLKIHKKLLQAFIDKKGIEMKESLNKISVVEERMKQREKKSNNIEEQIIQLKKQKEDLDRDNIADQNEMKKHATKKHNLEKCIDKEMNSLTEKQITMTDELNLLRTKLPKRSLDFELLSLQNEPTIPISKEDKMLTFLDKSIATKERELECPLCLEVSAPPIFMCPESHLVCLNCRPKVDKCPECRTPYPSPAKRHRYAEKTAEELLDLKKQRQEMQDG